MLHGGLKMEEMKEFAGFVFVSGLQNGKDLKEISDGLIITCAMKMGKNIKFPLMR